MSENPYKSPEADVQTEAVANQPSSAAKAIILGYIADMGITIFFSIVWVAYTIFDMVETGASPEEIEQQLQAIDHESMAFILLSLMGIACSILGGYVCARVAKEKEYKYAGILSLLLVVTGVFMGGGSGVPLWLNVSLYLATVLAVYLGAWLYVRGKP